MLSLLLILPYMWFSFIKYFIYIYIYILSLHMDISYWLHIIIYLQLYHISIQTSHSHSCYQFIAINIGQRKCKGDDRVQIHRIKLFGLSNIVLTLQLDSPLTHGYFLLAAQNHIPVALSYLHPNLSLSLSFVVVIAINIGQRKCKGDDWVQIHRFKLFGLNNVILTAQLDSPHQIIFLKNGIRINLLWCGIMCQGY